MVPAKLQRRPQKTKYQGKVATHYILHLSIDNAQSPAQIPTHAGDLVMPEADASVEAVAIRGEEEPQVAVGEAVEAGLEKHAEKTGADLPEPIEEADTAPAATIAVQGGKDKSQQAFVDGLKEDNKEEYGEPGKYELPAEAKALSFWEFMPQARAKFKAKGKYKDETNIERSYDQLYIDVLHTYSVQVLSELKGDEKKQGQVRELVEAEMEDRGIKW
jgi:hypothetical protein